MTWVVVGVAAAAVLLAGFAWVTRERRLPLRIRRLRQLQREGKVVKVLLAPVEVGGRDIAANTVWIPPEAAREKARFDAALLARLRAGESVDFRAKPEYRDDDMVPVRLTLVAGDQTTVIEIAAP